MNQTMESFYLYRMTYWRTVEDGLSLTREGMVDLNVITREQSVDAAIKQLRRALDFGVPVDERVNRQRRQYLRLQDVHRVEFAGVIGHFPGEVA